MTSPSFPATPVKKESPAFLPLLRITYFARGITFLIGRMVTNAVSCTASDSLSRRIARCDATTFEPRKSRVVCRRCGGADLRRVTNPSGILALIMQYRGRKPRACRACGWICYRPVKHDGHKYGSKTASTS
jgi:rubredoxin